MSRRDSFLELLEEDWVDRGVNVTRGGIARPQTFFGRRRGT